MIDLQVCKYKGVEIIFKEAPTSGGHRIVKYNYPGSNKQSIEIQGVTPRQFQIVGIIPHKNYYDIKDELIRVLEDQKKGILIHPTFGEVKNIISSSWSINEIISDLGRAEITIDFEVDNALGVPERVVSTKSTLNKNVLLTMDYVMASILAKLNLTSFVNNLKAGIALAKKVVAQVKKVTAFVAKVKLAIQSPALFAASFGGIFAEVYSLYESGQQAFNTFSRLFSFGDDADEIKPTTAARVQRKINQDVIIASVKTSALCYAYLSAVDIDYKTTEDIAITQDILENQYISIRENYVVSNEVLEQLERTRVVALDILDQQAISIPRVFTIELDQKIPLSVLVYRYYGNTDLFETIAELNNVRQNAFVSGQLNMVAA